MMMMKTLALLTVALAAVTAQTDEQDTASTDAVSVKFMGSSGGMKMYPTEDGPWLMLHQDKIEEIDGTGKVVHGENLAGKNEGWTPLAEKQVGNDIVGYTTTFSKIGEAKGKSVNPYKFSLTAYLFRTTSTIDEVVPCSNCTTGTAGDCQDEEFTCATSTEGVCDANYTQCTSPVTVTKDELKFSVFLSDWNFESLDNKINYGIFLSWKGTEESDGTNSTAEVEESDGEVKAAVAGAGFVEMPTKATIKGGEGEDQEVDIKVAMDEQGGKTVFRLTFPSFEEGQSIYYDPVMGLDSGSDGDDTSSAPSVSYSVATVGVLAMIASMLA